MSEIELEIPARKEYLALARLVVAATAELEPSFPNRRIEDLRLLVSEAATNAIRAHESHGHDERILIRCNLAADRIEIIVRDRGGGFDPEALASLPDVADPARLDHEGGFGLPLMASLADESDIRAVEGGTDVHLVVYLKEERP